MKITTRITWIIPCNLYRDIFPFIKTKQKNCQNKKGKRIENINACEKISVVSVLALLSLARCGFGISCLWDSLDMAGFAAFSVDLLFCSGSFSPCWSPGEMVFSLSVVVGVSSTILGVGSSPTTASVSSLGVHFLRCLRFLAWILPSAYISCARGRTFFATCPSVQFLSPRTNN